ncbi:ATP-binding protein [Tenacibaculum halocynthiae]|uniref:ATP-binding protein n=1 Tax=Tenacibaculum halocynthiae TaxID=1254437 RepID=UPI0038966BF9
MKVKNKKLYVKYFLVLGIFFSSCYTFKKNKEKIYHKEYRKFDLLTKQLSKKKLYDSALFYSDKLLKIAFLYKDSILLSNAYYKKGLYNKKKQSNDSAYFWYMKSKKVSMAIKDSFNISRRLLALAKIECENEFYLKSDSSAIECLRYTKNDSKFNKIKCSAYNCLGISSISQGNYDQAIKYYNKAINITSESFKKIRYIANKAVVYKHDKQYNKAINIYKSIIKNTFFKSIDLELKFKILDNYTYTKFLEGKEIDVNDFFEIQQLKDSINDNEGVITNYSYLSDYFYRQDKRKSLLYANKMYELAKKIKKPNDRIEAIDKLINLDLVKGNVLRKYANERNFLKDSIVDARKKSRNKLVKTIYNFDLLEKQKLKAQIDVEEQKTKKQGWIFIGLTTMLGFIIYIFYKRAKTKKEKVIEVYKTETRLAKKIHDELANDTYLAMSKLQKNDVKDSSLLKDLEKIYLQTRNISHENSPVLTGNQFEGFLKQLFADFSVDGCKVMSKGLSEIAINELSKEKQIVVYRVLQELLVNMKKYSKANLVIVSFLQIKETLQVKYKDNGIGVDTLEIKNGLQNMETRIKSIGGSIIFESEMQKGFQAKYQFKK